MEGLIIDPTLWPITLQNGWNWIGYISLRNQPIEQALGNLNASSGDLIKGKTQFAVYDPLLGWIGSLKTLKPGQGFMYKSTGFKTFTYPFAGMFANLQDEPASADDRGPAEAALYSANMTVIGALHSNCDALFAPERYTLALYDGRGVSRGYAGLEKVNDQTLTFLTLAGDPEEILQVRLIDSQGGPDVALDVPFAFEANSHLGDLGQPYVFEVSDAVCRQLAGESPETEPVFAAYPSNFTSYLMLEYTTDAADAGARVQLTNQAGQVVLTTEWPLAEGANERRIELAGRPLPSGMYTLELFANGKVERVKVVKAVP
jgi:hypothetical protein